MTGKLMSEAHSLATDHTESALFRPRLQLLVIQQDLYYLCYPENKMVFAPRKGASWLVEGIPLS